jgi:hypothetical protein
VAWTTSERESSSLKLTECVSMVASALPCWVTATVLVANAVADTAWGSLVSSPQPLTAIISSATRQQPPALVVRTSIEAS